MKKEARLNYPKKGEIYLVNFDPTVGSEIKKTRPAIILQNDISNQYSPVTIVAAISSYKSGDKIYPNEAFFKKGEGGLENDSLVLLNQIRTIDKKRLLKKLGKIESSITHKIEQALRASFDLID